MRLEYKDILIGYIGTLSDRQCKEIYYFLTGTGIDTTNNMDVIYFGDVRITRNQYNKLMWVWGKEKFDKCIEIMNKWLKEKAGKIPNYTSHYKQLISWVDDRYNQSYSSGKDKSIMFNSDIDTTSKAKVYVDSIPKELRGTDSEVKLLVNRFGKDVLS